jgi:glycosyltransferase involved in cell wall biosynthesis
VTSDPIHASRDAVRQTAFQQHDRDASEPQPVTEGLPRYPLDLGQLIAQRRVTFDARGLPLTGVAPEHGELYSPGTIAEYGLVRWNAYVAGHRDADRDAFVTQATWLLEHEVPASAGMGYWPVPYARPSYGAPAPSLSARVQGAVASVLVRAYRLLGDQRFLAAARRAVRTMAVDILDGGVAASDDADAIFFEEVAVYPAAHILSGHLFAVLGLYDYDTLVADPDVASLLARSHTTLHSLLRDFDAGYWSRYDLLTEQLATPTYHALHATQLGVLAGLTACDRCAEVARRWSQSAERRSDHVRAAMAMRMRQYRGRSLLARSGMTAYPQPGEPLRVCVPITAFPFSGGMRTIMAGMESAMGCEWDIEYLTRVIGPDAGGRKIISFGWPLQGRLRYLSVPNHFPNVLLYGWQGSRKLRALLRHRRYHVILAQDSVYTGAFVGGPSRRAGIRIVHMDHGDTTATFSDEYRAERLRGVAAKPARKRPLEYLRLALFHWTARRLARRAARTADGVLSPSDQSANTYHERLGVPLHRIVRYAGMIDVRRFAPAPDDGSRQRIRKRLGVPEDAVVLSMVGRLAAEKGLEFAVPAISAALHLLPAEQQGNVRLLIGGDGPLRGRLQADLDAHNLTSRTCLLGELAPDAVAELLSVSDVFLYAGTRAGAGPQVVYEAMASGCAVVASTRPSSVAHLLSEGRGIAVPASSVDALRDALVRCLRDCEATQQMGQRARAYIAAHHTAQALRRSLLRATYFAPTIPDAGSATVSTQMRS